MAAALGLARLAGAAYAGYLFHQYYQLKQTPDGWCSSAKSFGECIERGCIFVDVGLSNDPPNSSTKRGGKLRKQDGKIVKTLLSA